MSNTISEKDWDRLIGGIKDGRCTPFLGAGASHDFIPLGQDIAREWAAIYKYPLKDSCSDLSRVAQFLAINEYAMFPKDEIIKKFKNLKEPNYEDPDEPHGLLADFELPLYITTNYDNFMIKALERKKFKPIKELCRWNSILKKKVSTFDDHNFQLSNTSPVVYHLHGCLDVPASLVLTEDDYLNFLVNISKDVYIIPSAIQEAIANTTLLFIGYKLVDIDFRVLLKSILGYLENCLTRSHLSVQLIPGESNISKEEKDKAQTYLDKYFNEMDIKVYWGTCREFTKELRERWEGKKQ